jgi:hypothetical protein
MKNPLLKQLGAITLGRNIGGSIIGGGIGGIFGMSGQNGTVFE